MEPSTLNRLKHTTTEFTNGKPSHNPPVWRTITRAINKVQTTPSIIPLWSAFQHIIHGDVPPRHIKRRIIMWMVPPGYLGQRLGAGGVRRVTVCKGMYANTSGSSPLHVMSHCVVQPNWLTDFVLVYRIPSVSFLRPYGVVGFPVDRLDYPSVFL